MRGIQFKPGKRHRAERKNKPHRGPDRPPLTGVTHHHAEGIGEPRRYRKDGKRSNEIRDLRGIFKGVRRIHRKKAAAVGADHFDRFLACNGPHRNRLLSPGKRLNHRVIRPVLNHALAHEKKGVNHAKRQIDPERAAHHVRPEVSEVISEFP